MKRYSTALLSLVVAFVTVSAHARDEGIESLRQTGKAFAAVAREVSPSVVFIQVETTRSSTAPTPFTPPFGEEWPFGDDLFRRFFGEPSPRMPQEAPQSQPPTISQGSGFVFSAKEALLTDKTYILTNNHVVDGAKKIRVTFQDGREFDADITGTDPKSDVAVIEIDASGLPALKWGDSSKLEVGEWVAAIGNPFGLSHTLTVGVVSAKGRTTLGISDYEDFIQTDAAINPGNSGGPLVNLDSEVVGVNTAIFSRTGGYMGVGFAIPSNLARRIADQLIESGEVIRGFLGVVIQPLTPELAESFNLRETQGILVAQVADDSPAEAAGLRQGDVIINYQGDPVTDVGDFRNRVSLTAPGTKAKIAIIRDGERRELDVTIGKLGEEVALAEGPAEHTEELGLTVQTLTPQLAEQLGAKPGEGVVVTEVRRGSIAEMAGIEVGAIITQVNRKPVKNTAEFNRTVKESAAEKRVLLLIRQGEMQRYVVLRW